MADPNPSEYRDRGNVPQHLQIHLRKARGKLSSTMWKHWEPFFEHQERETGMSTLTTSSQHTTRHLGLSNQATEKIKGIHIGKEVVKLALFTNGMHGTVPGKPKRLHPKIVELIQQIRQRGRILNLCQEISHLSIRQR